MREMSFQHKIQHPNPLIPNNEILFNTLLGARFPRVLHLERERLKSKCRDLIYSLIKTKKKMKKSFQTIRVLALMAFVGCALGFTACSDDDDNNTPSPGEVTAEVIQGNYSGKMKTLYLSAQDLNTGNDGEESAQGVDITATIDKDSICFADFPIKDIVLSIVQDETMADQIVKAVGQVSYKVGYEGTLNAAKDSVYFDTTTKPLKLAVQIPSATNSEETQTLVVEVSVDPVAGGAYSVEDSEVKFSLNVTEIKLGEGDQQVALPNFNGMTLNFDMTQDKVTAHQ